MLLPVGEGTGQRTGPGRCWTCRAGPPAWGSPRRRGAGMLKPSPLSSKGHCGAHRPRPLRRRPGPAASHGRSPPGWAFLSRGRPSSHERQQKARAGPDRTHFPAGGGPAFPSGTSGRPGRVFPHPVPAAPAPAGPVPTPSPQEGRDRTSSSLPRVLPGRLAARGRVKHPAPSPGRLTLYGGGRRVAGPQLRAAPLHAAAHVVAGEDADALVDLARPPALVAGHVRVPGQHLHHVPRPQAQLVLAARLVLEDGGPERPAARRLPAARALLAELCEGLHGEAAP